MTQLFINNFAARLTQTLGPADTFLRLDTVAGLPTITGGDHLLLTLFKKVGADEQSHEVVRVTAIVMDQLAVVRAQEGTTAQQFVTGDYAEARATAGTFALKADIAALDKEVFDRLAADAAHSAALDPHPQYTTTAEAAAAAPVQSVAGATGAVVLKTVNGASLVGGGDITVQAGYGFKRISEFTQLPSDAEVLSGRSVELTSTAVLSVPSDTDLVLKRRAVGTTL